MSDPVRELYNDLEQLREDKNERISELETALQHIQNRLEYIDLRMQPVDWGSHDVETSFRMCIADCENALEQNEGDNG